MVRMNRYLRGAPLVMACLFLVACSNLNFRSNPDYDASKSHHRPDGFVNRYAERSDKPGLWRWQFERLRDGLPKPPAAPIVGVAPDLDLLHSDRLQARVTWVGHATLLVQVDGVNLLTDPHWGNRASPVNFAGPKRHQAPGIPFDKLPRMHAVVISHNHWDHLDRDTVQALVDGHPGIRFYVPLGMQYWFKKEIRGAVVEGAGRNVFAMDWDQQVSIPGRTHAIELHFLAVQHWSARSLGDRYETLWGSWAVIHPGFRFWFSGDLGYSPDTRDIGERMGGFDLAAIAIGAYEPRWFMKDSHLNPQEALQVMQDVKARSAVGIHWGTFDGMSDEPLDQPPRDLALARSGSSVPLDFFVLRHGQSWLLNSSSVTAPRGIGLIPKER
jgi:L-ascorbate metabolism protein UlaG (beta-lactamase superfamily)